MRSNDKGASAELLGNTSMSGNDCYANSADSDSQAVSDSRRKRRPQVGLRGARGRKYTPAERLAARTIKTPTCWIVQGYRNPWNGYVHVMSEKGQPRWSAHRLAYTIAYGPIPAGMTVMHSCDTPQCVNPAHLSLGTQAENVRDSIRKGRYNTYGLQRLNAAQVLEIRALARLGHLHKDIAKAFGVARNTVSGIVNRHSWAHLDDWSRKPSLVLEPAALSGAVVRVPYLGEVA